MGFSCMRIYRHVQCSARTHALTHFTKCTDHRIAEANTVKGVTLFNLENAINSNQMELMTVANELKDTRHELAIM